MPTRRKFRRNKRKTRRRGKRGGLGSEYIFKDGENTNLAFPPNKEEVKQGIKNLAIHYYIAKYTFGTALKAKEAPMNDSNKQIMENSLGLCYLLALQQIKDLVILHKWNTQDVGDNDPKKLFFKGIEAEQVFVKKGMEGKTFNGMNNYFTKPRVLGGLLASGKQFGTMMTDYGGSLGGPWKNPIDSNTIINHANWNVQDLPSAPFDEKYLKKINLLKSITVCLSNSNEKTRGNKTSAWAYKEIKKSGGIAFSIDLDKSYNVVTALFEDKKLNVPSHWKDFFTKKPTIPYTTPSFVNKAIESLDLAGQEQTSSKKVGVKIGNTELIADTSNAGYATVGGRKKRRRKRRTRRGGKSRRKRRKTRRRRRR